MSFLYPVAEAPSHALCTASGDPASREVWFPPGEWIDIFTRERHRGPRARRLTVPLERMPVFARAGAIVPLQDHRRGVVRGPLIVDAYPGRRGAFTLYEDSGDGLGYMRARRFARTRIGQRRSRRGTVVTLGRARGTYTGRPRRRAYELRVIGAAPPRRVTIRGRRLRRTGPGAARGWWYDRARDAVVIRTPRLSTARRVRVALRRR